MEIKRTHYDSMPKSFRKNGYDMVLILDSWKTIGIYKQIKDGVVVAYEVIRFRKRGDCMTLPSNEDWGTYGWTYTTYLNAFRKAKEVYQLAQI